MISLVPTARSQSTHHTRTPGLFQIAVLLFAAAFLTQCAKPQSETTGGEDYSAWHIAGGTPDNIHYSTLKQINRSNVSRLKVAWEYDTGDAYQGSHMECNPIVVRGVLYATTPKLRLIALNAATGKLLWSFTPPQDKELFARLKSLALTPNRGVTYWSDGGDERVFFVAGHNLYAVNAQTGKLISAFGDAGHVDLRNGLGRDPENLTVTDTSPGVIYKDLIIMGSSLPEDLPCPPGDIRAYDVRTGKMRWSFHTIPRPGEPGYNTWPKDAWKYTGRRQQLGRHERGRKARAWCLCLPAPPPSTFMAPTASATIFTPTACWRWTPRRASWCGISRR